MKFRQVYVEITNVCNLSCSFCVQKHEEPRFLSLEQFERILTQIKPYTSYVYLHILGEPLMHPQLEGLLKLCQEYEVNVHITTNGTLLMKNFELLKKYPVRQINVSVHSFTENEMNQEDYLNQVFEVCDVLSENTYISYRLWCMKNHVLDKEASVIFDRILNKYQITSEQLEQNRHTLEKNRFLSFDEVFTWPSMNHDFVSDKGYCRGLKDMLGILSNGDVVPCCLDAYGKAKLGNIFEKDLDAILESELSKSIHQGFLDNKIIHPLCQRCQYRTRFDK